MSTETNHSAPLVPLKLVIGIVLVGVLSFFAFFALLAYAPEFRDDNDGGTHALSKSAIGFAAMGIFLRDAGLHAVVDRGLLHKTVVPSLAVQTPGPETSGADLYALDQPEPRLIILPKWLAVGDPLTRGRVMKDGLVPPSEVYELLKQFSATTGIARLRAVRTPGLRTTLARADIFVPKKLQAVDSLQTITGPDWIPVITSDRGEMVLARWKKGGTYVLADPDFMNTHGLHDLATASLALSIVRSLRTGQGPIGFDVTLNGYKSGPNLLRDIFAPPFLGATLCAILAALLLALHAASSFGSPIPAARVFALGKGALVENTAQLIRMMHREPHMAARYAAVTRDLVLRALGSRRDAEDAQRLISALERDRGPTYDELLARAREVENNSDLMKSAGETYRWRQRMTHGT
jgi:hypothetical protein